jgi:hypothetical protein
MKKLLIVAAAVIFSAVMGAQALRADDPGYGRKTMQQVAAGEGDAEDLYQERASRTGFWMFGAGAAVNSMPISASKFTLPLVYLGYESIEKKALGDYDFSWAFGLYDLMPEVELGMIIPAKPFDFRFSAGGFYDVIIGGTLGVLLKAGVIINKAMEFDLMFIPIGTQPSVSYSESLAQQHIVMNDGKHGLDFPVYGILVGYRF